MYEEKYNFNEFLGFCYEILGRFGYSDSKNNPTTSGVAIADFYWPKPIGGNPTELRVKFIDTDPNIGSSDRIAELEDRVIKSAKVWEQYAFIHFKLVRPDEDADIRIRVSDGSELIHHSNGRTSYSDNSSQIGTTSRFISSKEPTMRFTTLHKITEEEAFSALVQHEFGHALGLLHEQTHSDANINFRVMTILHIELYSQSPEQAEKSAIGYLPAKSGLLTYEEMRYPNPSIDEKAYDPLSIMHYEIPASAASNGRATNRGKNNTKISEGDKGFIRTVYPFPN